MVQCKSGIVEKCFKELDEYIDTLEDKKGALIHVLHRAQHIFGYLPVEVQQHIAQKTDVPISKIYGVVSFYTFFTMRPRGKYPVSICNGTACYVKGAEKILDEFRRNLDIDVGETTNDGKFSIDILRCVGACGMAPVVSVGEKVYARVTPDMVKKIIDEHK